MFVRTKKGKIFDCVVHEQMGKPIYYPKTSETNGYIDWNEVYKKSENIIDILEVGDYVNGYLIMSITDVNNKDVKGFEVFRMNGTSRIKMWEEEDIKTIVTKEQFESMSYKVGE